MRENMYEQKGFCAKAMKIGDTMCMRVNVCCM